MTNVSIFILGIVPDTHIILILQEEVQKHRKTITEFEETTASQKNKITTLDSNKTKVEKNLKISQETVLSQKKSISNLEMIIKNNEIEIQRLQNIKWYNKLIGKK